MYNTAMGLGLALLCMIAHVFLSSASKKVIADLEAFSLKLENVLGEGPASGQGQGGQA
jgi:biopolymer transport protein ExbB